MTTQAFASGRRHQNGMKYFHELTYKEQALSINGTLANLRMAVGNHAAKDTNHKPSEVFRKVASQLSELVNDFIARAEEHEARGE